MKRIKLAPFILVMVFTMQVMAQTNMAGVAAVGANVVTTPVFVPPTALTSQLLASQLTVALVDNVVLNKLTELLNYAENEGMQRDWFLNNDQAAALNMLVTQPTAASEANLKAAFKAITTNILTSLNRGYVSPEKLGEKTNVKSKKAIASAIMNAELLKYAMAKESADDLFATFRPKNPDYTKLLTIYKKITAMNQAGEIKAAPANLGTVKPGSTDAPTILFARQRLAMFGYENDVNNASYTDDLKQAIFDLQENNLLKGDGVIGKSSFGLLNTPIDQIITRLKINLDRSRWLPDDLKSEYVHINLAAQRLFYYKDNAITLTFRTINGRVERPTPIMIDAINHMNLNPTWTVPKTIYFQDKGKLFASNPDYAAKMHYRFYDLRTNPPTEVGVRDINWLEETSKEKEAKGEMLYRIVQSPGGDSNALGWVKFPLLRNSLNIYMHDTNERDKFPGLNRLLSSGCIRLEKPFELAEKLLSNQVDATTTQPLYPMATLKNMTVNLVPTASDESQLPLGRVVPVYVMYETTQVNDKGQMTLVADPYGIDMDMYDIMMNIPMVNAPAVGGSGG